MVRELMLSRIRRRHHPRGSMRRASGLVLTGNAEFMSWIVSFWFADYPEATGNMPPSTAITFELAESCD